MPNVTVAGAHSSVVTLSYDTAANAALATRLAAAITASVHAGTMIPAENATPPLPAGKTGEYIQTTSGFAVVPGGYSAIVDAAPNAVIAGSGDPGESVLVGAGNLSFVAQGGSGTIAGGGGNDGVLIPASDTGGWQINLGNGNNSVYALGGSDTISLGSGHNLVELGASPSFLVIGNSTVVASGAGAATLLGASAGVTAGSNGAADPPATSTGAVAATLTPDSADMVHLGGGAAIAPVAQPVPAAGSAALHLSDGTTITFTDATRHAG